VNRLVIPERQTSKNTKKEYLLSALNLLVFTGFGGLLDYLKSAELTKFYFEIEFTWKSLLYLPASLFISLFIHDLFFYLSHRFLHLPFMHKYVHVHHHQSHTVNAWAAFSFHPIEGCIQISIVCWLPLILPIHPVIHGLFTLFMLFMSVYGHSGYELRAKKAPIFNAFNTSFHHAQHHQYGNYNFGIYLNFWDRLFKTNHATYEDGYKRLREHINGSKGVE
jgi:lathosterol oxidase